MWSWAMMINWINCMGWNLVDMTRSAEEPNFGSLLPDRSQSTKRRRSVRGRFHLHAPVRRQSIYCGNSRPGSQQRRHANRMPGVLTQLSSLANFSGYISRTPACTQYFSSPELANTKLHWPIDIPPCYTVLLKESTNFPSSVSWKWCSCPHMYWHLKKAKNIEKSKRCCVSDISSETLSRCQAIGPSSRKEGPMSRSSRATRIRAFRSEVDPLLDTGRLESKFGKSQVFTSKTSVLICGKSKLILKLRPSIPYILSWLLCFITLDFLTVCTFIIIDLYSWLIILGSRHQRT